ncbi:dihydrodipicolinate synthase family protein [Blastomonas sp. UPD001]|uniref:dihydrodipicolinate synthase family protein n=1 Tax=Blastomonas sp. UPD001 TaxID=2217673 RepID=UPI000E352503|nr:dihydrodipicolinate synthase family protein [Blastomonas sp. UPD001]
MTTPLPFVSSGVIPACLLPFKSDLAVDETAYLHHLKDVAAVDGISGITVNGHASEVSSCSIEEQQHVLAISAAAVGDRLPLISGIYTDGSLEAQRLARMNQQEGASALLVFPPSIFAKGAQLRDEMVIAHFKHIADATDLPLIGFQYALASGAGYRVETLLKLADQVPSFVAIKDMTSEPAYHEIIIRAMHGASRRISVLTTHSSWLLSSLVLGCDGILSGSGSLVADLYVQLWRAVEAKDLAAAQTATDRIFHWTQAIYRAPMVDSHNRMKEALVLCGRLKEAHVRPPLVRIGEKERALIADGLKMMGLIQ